MGSESVDLAGIIVGQFNLFEFTTPVTVNGNFHVGYELEYVTPADSFGIYLTPSGAASYTTYLFSGPGTLNNTWQDVGTDFSANIALLMEVLTSNGTAPTADYQVTNAAACVGGSFGVNAGVSSGTIDTYNWSLSDNPWTQEYVNFDGATVDVISPTVSTGSQKVLWLIAYGACTYDLVGYLVDVYAEVTATVTHVNASCGNDNGSIEITATGGDGTYTYSIHGGATTSSTGTFNDLAAGSYDVEVTTTGNGCSYTETVVVTGTPAASITVSADDAICEGDVAALTASGTGSIEWFDGATSVGTGETFDASPTVPTTYDVVLTDGNGCTDTKQIFVDVTPLEDASFTYASNTICLGGGNETPTSVATTGGTFTASSSDLVFANSSTGEIDMASSLEGTYDVTYTTAGTCAGTEVQSLTITTAPDASFTYANTEYCNNGGTVAPTFPTGASAGTFTSTAGLVITSGTGVINLATSDAGTYTVTNTIAASGACTASSETFSITVKETPTVDAGADQAVCEGTDVTLTATGADTYAWDNGITQGTPFTPGVGTLIYTVTGTGVNGCENTDQVSVVVTANPTVNAGADQSVCEGESVTLTATNSVGTVSWDNGVTDGTAFTPTATETYTVTADNNGCTATDVVTVTVNSLPTVSAGTDQTACVDHSAFTLSGTPSGGTFSGTGVSGNSFDPETAGEGTHTVTYTYADGNRCENSATITVTVDGCVGLDKNELNQLTVAPNPASDYIEVRVNENNAIKNIQLMSLAGKVVSAKTTTIDSNTTQIDVSSIAKGTYFIQLSTDNGQLVRKVIVQ